MTEFEVFRIAICILLLIGWVYICFQVWRIDKLTEQVRTLEHRIDFILSYDVRFIEKLEKTN